MLPKSTFDVSVPRLDLAFAAGRDSGRQDGVLVALDGGAVAERALPLAVRLARRWNAPLRLVHVRNPSEGANETDYCVLDDGASLAVESRTGLYLKGLAAELHRRHDLTVECEMALGNSVADSLRSLARYDASALVMVRTRRSGLSRFWWGSVTDSLAGRLRLPLLLVPEAGEAAPGAPFATHDDEMLGGFSRILVHMDSSPSSICAVDTAISLAAVGGECHLLRVLPLASLYSAGKDGASEAFDLRTQAWQQLTQAQERLEARGIACLPRLLFDGRTAAAATVDQARAVGAQVTVVAAGPSAQPWWRSGHVMEHIVRHSPGPVLVACPEKEGSPDVLSLLRNERVDASAN